MQLLPHKQHCPQTAGIGQLAAKFELSPRVLEDLKTVALNR